tara:strand:- start:650 stop:811 length:162 start_codon:yes stop_codon:yes gene_type:complete
MNQTIEIIVDTSTIKAMNKGQTELMKYEDQGFKVISVKAHGFRTWKYKLEKAL